jgi:hypothetical protein
MEFRDIRWLRGARLHSTMARGVPIDEFGICQAQVQSGRCFVNSLSDTVFRWNRRTLFGFVQE